MVSLSELTVLDLLIRICAEAETHSDGASAPGPGAGGSAGTGRGEPASGEARAASMCESCLSLPLGMAVSMESHPRLGLVDCVEVDGDPVNRYEHYCCVSCQTRWIRYVDRWGTDMGFRLGEQSYDV